MHGEDKILAKTYTDYNTIADKFSRVRKQPWNEFDFLFEEAKEGERILDLGCGNGRFYERLKHTDYLGIDNADELIKLAREKYGEDKFKIGSALDIPGKKDEFDKVFAIALLHHLPPLKHKVFIKEIERVLKKGGRAIITVWNMEERKKKNDVKEIRPNEILIPWFGAEDHYFYTFSQEELKNLFKNFKIIETGEIKVKKFLNYYIIAEKI